MAGHVVLVVLPVGFGASKGGLEGSPVDGEHAIVVVQRVFLAFQLAVL